VCVVYTCAHALVHVYMHMHSQCVSGLQSTTHTESKTYNERGGDEDMVYPGMCMRLLSR
jgi:hypothetical protein